LLKTAALSAECNNGQHGTNMASILVIDDQMELRTLFHRILERGGHSVITAEGGEEAVRATEAWIPDLVLLDMAMPQMDGLAFLRVVRARPGWKDVPIIVLSGMLSAEQMTIARQLGACDQLVKGQFTTRELRSRVARHLGPSPSRPSSNAA
jgi:two-component system cell cycle response regulator DivK